MEKFKKKMNSISFRLPGLIVIGSMIMFFIIAQIAYLRFDDQMIREYKKISNGVSAIVIKNYEPDRQDEYIDKRFESEKYRLITDMLSDFKEAYSDIDRISIYKCTPDGMSVIFDPSGQFDNSYIPYDCNEIFGEKIYTIMDGREVVDAVTKNNKGETIYLTVTPIFNSKGECVAFIEISFSIDKMRSDNINFLLSTMTLALFVMCVIWSITMYDIHKKIIGPINKMRNCITSFRYDTTELRLNNLYNYEQLKIKTGNELELFYNESLNVAKQNLYHLMKYNHATDDIKKLAKTVYRDELTKVGSKMAYVEKVQLLDKQIAEYKATFAVVMIDINNLKQVNDTFGHKKGDEYIKSCCGIICDIFAHSPVYRIGGDEFIVILEGQDYDNRFKLVERAMDIYEIMYSPEDKPLYERYSASIGLAEFTDSDTTYEKVFSRADKNMYENKAAFKRVNGSYR